MKLITTFSQYLLKILPIINSTINQKELSLHIPFQKVVPIIFFLKNHTNCQFKILSDLCVVDYLNKKERLNVIYNFKRNYLCIYATLYRYKAHIK